MKPSGNWARRGALALSLLLVLSLSACIVLPFGGGHRGHHGHHGQHGGSHGGR